MSRAKVLIETIASRFGLVPQPSWPERIDGAVAAICDEQGVSPAALFERLHCDADLLRSLAGRMTVEETFFFRQSNHFGTLLAHLGARLRAIAPGDTVRIWSAGCAAGDEPYSLAIAIAERFNAGDRQRVEIIATDINLDAIERARSGLYRKWSFRNLDHGRIRQYFKQADEGTYRLCDDIRKRVRFVHLSIQDHAARMAPESLDAILFRNVAVYLDEKATDRVYTRFARALRKDGWLLVAGSDQRPNKDSFVERWSADMTVYQRAASHNAAAPGAEPNLAHAASQLRSPGSSPRFDRSGSVPQQNSRPAVDAKVTPQSIELRLDRARHLANQGAYQRALRSCNQTIGQTPMRATAFQLRGEVLFHLERFTAAATDFHRAMRLNANDLIAHYWYVIALQASGHPKDALREAAGVAQQMSSLATNAVLSDGKTTAGELLSAVRSLKQDLE